MVGLLVGALLGVSGALLQALVRNPLAAPELTGLTQGAVVGVLLCLALVPGQAAGGADLARRPAGGERQRAWIALTLAQQTPLLLVDEPTTYLDVGHQLEVLELVERLNREQGLTVVMVLHDLGQAARFADQVVVLDDGAVVAAGAPSGVLTAEPLRDVFQVEAEIRTAATGELLCIPLRSLAGRTPVS